ncbi:MAG: hypothetical protein JW741_24800 [Sedimentisphaerales bacterium]|nr:hypothetical protein [Sedimentisphaerales bacterium]
MSQPAEMLESETAQSSRRRLLLVMGLPVAVAGVCFVVLALLPASKQPFFEAPLRSALTGLGVLGISCPLCVIGSILRRRAESSPYFEEGFIAGAISLIGLVCLLVGLLCLGLSVYAVARNFLGQS